MPGTRKHGKGRRADYRGETTAKVARTLHDQTIRLRPQIAGTDYRAASNKAEDPIHATTGQSSPVQSITLLVSTGLEQSTRLSPMPPTLYKDTNYSLTHLIEEIKHGKIALPDIQRPFVWSPTRVRDLFDSMYRGYPIGTLLFWETDDPSQSSGCVLATQLNNCTEMT